MYSFSHFNCKLYIFYCQTLLSLTQIDPVDILYQNCVFNKTYWRDFSCLYELQWGGRERSLNHSPSSGFVDWIHLLRKKAAFSMKLSTPSSHTSNRKNSELFCLCYSFFFIKGYVVYTWTQNRQDLWLIK